MDLQPRAIVNLWVLYAAALVTLTCCQLARADCGQERNKRQAEHQRQQHKYAEDALQSGPSVPPGRVAVGVAGEAQVSGRAPEYIEARAL